ncbi:MAG: glycosyltransferase family 2 protein [Nanoarchaeota archaeon]|nr:glycosyltransferase family 2 protein [Nanoarchaeota archaeon]
MVVNKKEEKLQKKGISIIVPCYNESKSVLKKTLEGVEGSLKKIKSRYDYEIIVVNDGSKRKFNYDDMGTSVVRIVNHKINRGYGASLKTGIENSNFDWIGITDADGTYPIDQFHILIDKMENYDMVVGARQWKHISLFRKFPKFVLTMLASFLSNHYIPDLNSGMRVFRKDVSYEFWKLYPNGFSFTSTITMGCLTNGFSVKYIPINYFKREGKSYIHPIKDTIRFFSLVTRLTLYFAPLRFFIPLTLVLSILTLLRAIRDINVQDSFGGLTLVLFFMTFQVFFFGLLAEIITKMNKNGKN